jgi:uronate dehydrogenase
LRGTLAALADELVSVDIVDAPATLLIMKPRKKAENRAVFDEVLPLMER